jgi:hypothetical protein
MSLLASDALSQAASHAASAGSCILRLRYMQSITETLGATNLHRHLDDLIGEFQLLGDKHAQLRTRLRTHTSVD